MTEGTARGGVKTLAIRLPDELHAQLVLVAGLDGISLTDAIRQGIEGLIERKRGEGDLAARAASALAEIEREADARRAAIQSLFGSDQAAEITAEPAAVPGERPKGRSPRPSGCSTA
ncbi:MAG: hypothetical protein ACR2KM_12420 [Gemmatimonadaceae bacterium]